MKSGRRSGGNSRDIESGQTELDPVGAGTKDEWPQGFQFVHLLGAPLYLGVGFLGAKALSSGHPLMAAGASLLALSSAILAVVDVQHAGFRHIWLSRGVVSGREYLAYRGIEIGARTGSLVLLCVFVLLMSAGGLLAGAAHYLGFAETLLPASRDTAGGAAYMTVLGVAGVLLASFLWTIRPRTTFLIGSAGVLRRTHQWNRFKRVRGDLFVAWDDIVSIDSEAKTTEVLFAKVLHPKILLRTSAVIDPDVRTAFDDDHTVTIMMDTFVVEPNMFLGLVRFLKENPERRDIVERDDARELLRPPPLRERFRSARLAERSR